MDKKTLPLIILLAVLAFTWWSIWPSIASFFGLEIAVPPPTATDSTQVETATQIPEPTTPTRSNPVADQNPDLTSTQSSVQTEALDQMAEDESVGVGEPIIVKTNLYTVQLSDYGGAPVSIVLKEHTLRDGTPIDMLSESSAATPEILFGGGTWTTGKVIFESDTRAGEYDVTSGERSISFVYTNGAGSKLIRKYTFYADSYHYDFELEVTDPASFGFESRYSLNWQTPMGVVEPNPKTDYEAMEAVAMQSGGRETIDDYDNGVLNQELEGATKWVGTRNKYFTAIMIPSDRPAESASAKGEKTDIRIGEDDFEKRELSVALDMEFVSSAPIDDKFTIYVGPLDYTLLSEYKVGLEDILGIGTTPYVGWIIKPFAIGIIWLLPRMYDIIPNYGWVIILFAFLVKVITLPLSMKSFESMQAMKELQPEMEKIKKQYAKNPQQMNKETMALYKKHGVNPMAGCLPMLPQMPLFFALFSVFRSTILLRDANWFWFITDLSRGAESLTDPYMVLVVLMIAAQFVSQKMTMGANPQNKMMMYMMPLFMGFIFRGFASGLVLYWACFSIFSLLDWVLFKRKALTGNQVQTA